MEGSDNLRGWGPVYDNANSMRSFMSSINGDLKPFRSTEAGLIAHFNGGYHRDYTVPTPHYLPGELNSFYRDRDTKFYNMLSTENNSYVLPSENPTMHMLRQRELSNDEKMTLPEPSTIEINSGPLKKRSAGKCEKPAKLKKQKKAPSGPKDWGSGSAQRAKSAKKTTEVVINGIDMDISNIPIPVCSCTGSPQQCYRWGFGGWQSACCTTGMSMYPLPMSTKRRGARIAGRKMSLGAFKKVLEKLAAEGYNFANPIDLRTHWAKHGTNKFVTIR